MGVKIILEKYDIKPQNIRRLVAIAEKYSSLGEPYTTVLEELKTKIQIIENSQPKPETKPKPIPIPIPIPTNKDIAKPKTPNASSNTTTVFTPQNTIISIAVLSVVIGLICTNDDEENDLSSVLGNILPSFTML